MVLTGESENVLHSTMLHLSLLIRPVHACPQPVSGGIVYIKYCVCKIRHLVLCTTTTTDGRQYLLNIFCMSTETDRLLTGMVWWLHSVDQLRPSLKFSSRVNIDRVRPSLYAKGGLRIHPPMSLTWSAASIMQSRAVDCCCKWPHRRVTGGIVSQNRSLCIRFGFLARIHCYASTHSWFYLPHFVLLSNDHIFNMDSHLSYLIQIERSKFRTKGVRGRQAMQFS